VDKTYNLNFLLAKIMGIASNATLTVTYIVMKITTVSPPLMGDLLASRSNKNV
jgi:hypothetical protein